MIKNNHISVIKIILFPTTELENRVLDSISIKLSDEFLPEDYFAEKRATVIWLYGHYPFPYTILKVDVNAFRSTKNHTKKFEFVFIDFKELNLGFLSEFNQLTNLKFSHSVNIEHCLPTLPLMLPSLTSLSFSACEGLSRLHNFPTLFRGLDEMVLSYYENYELNDETTSQIFDWLLLSSANTLKHLTLQGIGPHLTRVPRQISNFTNLDHFFLTNNNISTIKSGDLSFSVPVMHLYLDNNGIKLIEPGAFKGIPVAYINVSISLYLYFNDYCINVLFIYFILLTKKEISSMSK